MKKILLLITCLMPLLLMAQVTPKRINIKVAGVNPGKLISTVAKNATKDSIIITLNDGTRFAVKDSVGSGGGGSATWGGITGTLSSQTDLQTALNAKQNSLSGTGYLKFSGSTPLYNATIPNSDLTNSTISGISLGGNLANLTATDGTLTFSGTYNGATARTVGINLVNNFTWTGTHQFGSTVRFNGMLNLNGTLGTAGQSLRVNSGATGMEWYTPSSGGVTLPQLNDSLAKYVKKDSVGELTTDSHLSIAPDGDDTKISLDNIDDITAGGDLSGTYPNPTVAKLNGQLPSYYLNRANHTGTQTSSTISDFTSASQTVGDARYVKLADSSKFLRKEDSGKYVTPTAFNNGLASVKPSQPKFKGEEYYKYSTWSNLNDFTDNTMSATVSGGNIVIPDANVSDFTKYLTLDSINCTNHWKLIMLCKRTSNPGGSGSGISLGMKSINSDAICSNAFYFNGTLQYFYNSNGAGWATSVGGTSSALTYANNDSIRFEIERNDQNMTGTVENKTNASAVARSISVDLNLTSDPVLPNTARPTIFAQGGGWQVLSLRFMNLEVNTPNVLLVGDSKTMGFGATKDSTTIYGQLKKRYNGVAVSGGFGDKISDMLLRLPELVGMHAKVVVLNSPGSNDIRFGRSVSATMADYATLRQAFLDDGSTVIDVSPCYEAAQDLNPLYQAWKAAYGALSTSVDIFNIPRKYGLADDNIHLNDASNKAIAKRIIDLNIIEGAKN